MPSEKCVGGWGSDHDEMRMITASFARAIERFADDLCLHFLPLFQQVVAVRKTCNQLRMKTGLLTGYVEIQVLMFMPLIPFLIEDFECEGLHNDLITALINQTGFVKRS